MIHFEAFYKHFEPLADDINGKYKSAVLCEAWDQYVMLIEGIRDGRISDNGVSAWMSACKEVEADPEF